MITIDRPTRRLLFRLAFLGLALCPTLLTVAACSVFCSPWYQNVRRQRVLDQITRHSGLRVDASDLKRRAGKWHASRLDFRDPEFGKLVFRIQDVSLHGASDRWMMTAAVADIHETPWRTAWPRTLHWVTETPTQPWTGVVRVKKCNLHGVGHPRSYQNVTVKLAGSPKATTLEAVLQQKDHPPLRLGLERIRSARSAITTVQMDTGDAGLAAKHLINWLPEVEMLGQEAVIHGQVAFAVGIQPPEFQLQGTVRNLDLDRCVSDRFPHKLSGIAEIDIKHMTVSDGRIQRLEGSVSARDGVISRSLLDAAQQHLGVQVQFVEAQRTRFRYDRLQLDFELGAAGFVCQGSLNPEGQWLSSSEVSASIRASRYPAVAVVRTLAPESQWQVPAVAESDQLLRWLPIPRVSPTASSAKRSTYVPLRLKR